MPSRFEDSELSASNSQDMPSEIEIESRGSVDTGFSQLLVRPGQTAQRAPCSCACAGGSDVREWIAVVAQRERLGLSAGEAYTKAWNLISNYNPFPATLGRICPHPCEAACSRSEKDGAVAINALERFLGDWALAQRLPLRKRDESRKPESIGVIGAGPAGLSFAYQMARRGHHVTVYEKAPEPGGMLRYGIPAYRLPKDVLEAEIRRIKDLGVEIILNTAVGKAVSVQCLKQSHTILFLGLGAGKARMLGIPGENGPGVWTGTDYLARLNSGERIDLGCQAVIVGGGNTAIDAARAARRHGAHVTVVYRRTRDQMPAIESEVDDAAAEQVVFEFLAAPVEIKREAELVQGLIAQRMILGEPDDSGRPAAIAVSGSEFYIPADSVIVAVSQEPQWDGLEDLNPGAVWLHPAEQGSITDDVWAGGDALGLGIAGLAIAQGRQAAEALDAKLRKDIRPRPALPPRVSGEAIDYDYYPPMRSAQKPRRPVEVRLREPDLEIQETISESAFLEEVARCFSCGACMGCEQCYMYCNAGGFTRVGQVEPGSYFALSLDKCEGCGKCIELCPPGFLNPL